MIETVLGPLPDSELGFTLSHEHVTVVYGDDMRHYPWLFDRERMLERATAALSEAKAAGVDTILDLTGPDLGREITFIEEAARRSGMQIVAATGTWRDVPRSFSVRDVDASADIFVREIEVGIEETSIKAGVIKVATDVEGISEGHENVLRAAARASKRTGCPISTHHHAQGEQGREQLRIFLEEGASPDRICIGHSGDTTDTDYLEFLLEQGVYLSFDRYPGRPGRPGWEERNATVKTLIDRGWAGRLMLGHDHSATRPVEAGHTEPTQENYNPDGFLFLTNIGIPALLESGVTQEQVDLMMREVPRRFLSGEGER